MERSCLLLLFFLSSSPAVAVNFPIAQPGCPDKCGDVDVPYPFGINKNCYREGFGLLCDNSTNFNSPKLFMNATVPTTIEVTNINLLNSTATILYTNITKQCNNDPRVFSSINLGPESPLTFSYTRNKVTAIGCDTMVFYRLSGNGITGCMSFCNDRSLEQTNKETCSGVGCCQAVVPRGEKIIRTALSSVFNYTNTANSSNCSHAFLVEEDWYKFKIADVIGNFTLKEFPVILDWAIGKQTCEEAKNSTTTDFVCGDNSRCLDSTNGSGYQCACKDGFQGNPYLPTGCKDIDECKNSSLNNCSDICTNTPGGHICSCPDGKQGDGKKTGEGCIAMDKSNKNLSVQLVLGIGSGIVFLCAIVFMLYLGAKKRKMMRLREMYFERNGGELLKQKSMHEGGEGVVYTARIFTEDELKTATRNFSEERVVGRGGNGTVYMGILKDSTVVAIKKSKMIEDQTDFQKEQFINEVIILSQVIHRNVVKIVGCCLETQVPLLVYEYIPNNTLYHHIHGHSSTLDTTLSSPMSWSTRLRIATETSSAVAYLHFSLSTPVIHRDIKLANILLDENFTTKVSDFGASRLVPLTDQIEIATMVQGTLGYLDPEYFHTGHLTDKSDVYSFGVVLAELLTCQKPISFFRKEEDRILASYFVKCLKENRLLTILDPVVVRECGREELDEVTLLVKACLHPMGEQRPNMKEVAAELEKLRRYGKSSQTTVDVVANNDDHHPEDNSRKTASVGCDVIEEMGLLYCTQDGSDSVGESSPSGHVKLSFILQR